MRGARRIRERRRTQAVRWSERFERNETDGPFSSGSRNFSYRCPPYIFSGKRLDGFDLIAVKFDQLSPVPLYVPEISGRDPVHDRREIENSHAAAPARSQIKL